ncbi:MULTISPECIES: phosphoglycolate phosphatase [unclassified Guyparkeria]|uniref:phosphoglycolate phosphatase n=1 Tax=unclassified Guyparkeria TaxID=2626246 RepID=UPI0007333F44|nr:MULTISPECIES: phosphoglycolate phosphatase [unclassified Guyparkeria]KTG16901.1 phosphoglycolate phosphatase [Guyparkeria sp. XI15]OAE85935.1 phosphoglycolate phosphatase [Guyparkeria sp. WRN-7]
MAQFTPRMVLFDLDGTLVDSVPDLHVAVNAMQAELGNPERTDADVRTWVGNGIERLVERALTNDLDGTPDPAEFDKALPVFKRAYAESNGKHSKLFDGVTEGLDFIKSLGLSVGCVTNKASAFTLPLLEQTGLKDHFEVIISGDTLPLKKPDPAPLIYSAGWFHVHPSEALMIGDSISDVKAARAAGFSIVCMSYGYNHGKDIRDYDPDAVIDSMTELAGLVGR